MINMINADLYKLRKMKSFKLLLIIMTGCALAMTALAYAVSYDKIPSSLDSLGFMFSDVNVISIIAGVVASILICNDFENKTIQSALSTGISRTKMIESKVIVFSITIASLLIPYVIIVGIALCSNKSFDIGNVAIGFLNILRKNSTMSLCGADYLKYIIVSLTLILLYIAQVSVCIPIAVRSKKPVITIAGFYFLSILFGQLSNIAAKSKGFDKVFSYTVFSGKYQLMNINTSYGMIIKSIIVSVVFIIIIMEISNIAFKKAEIK